MTIELTPAGMTADRRINISEWNDKVEAYVKDLSVLDHLVFREQFLIYSDENRSSDERAEGGLCACIMSIVDKDGNPLLAIEQLDALKKMSFKPVTRLLGMLLNPDAKDESFKKN